MKKSFIIMGLLLMGAGQVWARLGATPEEMVSRFGPASNDGNTVSGVSMYHKDDVTVYAWFDNGRVVRVRYVRAGDVPFDREDIVTLLGANRSSGWAPAIECTPHSPLDKRPHDTGKWICADHSAEAQAGGNTLEVWSTSGVATTPVKEKKKYLTGF